MKNKISSMICAEGMSKKMKNLALNALQPKWIFWSLLVLAIVSLLPLLYIARFTHPSADDFSYGVHTIEAWRETGSIVQTISAGVQGSRYMYNTWQGSFVAMFFMTLHPAVFSENLYMLGPIFLILGFIAATIFLLKVIFIDYFGADKYSFGIVSIIFTFISVQFIFSPVEGFFWYNAAIYYTGFHSLSLVLFALTLLWMKAEKRCLKIACTILIPILSFMVGGSNFITALTSTVIMGLFFAYCLAMRKELFPFKWILPLAGTIMLCAALTIAIIAPGNAIRQEYFQSMPPLSAILNSFEFGILFIRIVVSTPIWLAFACITPLIFKIVKNSGFQFRYPVLAILLFYGVYVSTFTPNLYAWSSFGPARVVNINLFAFLFFLLFSIIYLAGYILRIQKSRRGKKPSWIKAAVTHPVFTAVLAALFIISCYAAYSEDENSMASVSAAKSLYWAEARVFHNENLERREILHNPEIQHVEFYPLSAQPHLLFFMDITTDPTVWPNTSIAQFYNKESVRLIPRQSN